MSAPYKLPCGCIVERTSENIELVIKQCDCCAKEFNEPQEPGQTWMRNDGIDAINWPKPITVVPVNTDHLEAQARRILERMADES